MNGGVGVGIEIVDHDVRAVVVAGATSHPPVATGEVPINRPGTDGLVDALIRVAAAVNAPAAPVRVAWFPPGATMQATDVTGHHPGRLAEWMRRCRHDGHDAVALVDTPGRRWAVVLRWDQAVAERIEAAARRAGFGDVAVEPSPLSLARLPGRDLDDGTASDSPAQRWQRRDEADTFAVALGAARAAGGPIGARHTLRSLASAPTSPRHLPWLIERLADGPAQPERRPLGRERWRRFWRYRRSRPGR